MEPKNPTELGLMSIALGLLLDPSEPRRVGQTEVTGLRISTVETRDYGWETAIVDAVNAHPVERYATEADARAGHDRWVAAASTLTVITKLGWGEVVPPVEVTLERWS